MLTLNTIPPLNSRPAPHSKLLIMEFWGLGDLTFSTPLLQRAVDSWEVTLAGKAHARSLLAPSFPGIEFVEFDAPWSAYRGKYRIWEWDWPALLKLIRRLRSRHFDAAVSVRNDPRDHLLMWLIGATARYGFPARGSSVFLTHLLVRSQEKQHKVEDWREIGRALGLTGMDTAQPRLDHPKYRTPRVDSLLAGVTRPLVCLHPGARISVRRWPEEYFARILDELRSRFSFHLLLIPDPDGYGNGLRRYADTIVPNLSVEEMVDILGRVDLLLCNDSGPGHLAASCQRPAIPIFGPTDPDWFRPWGDIHQIIIRDICPWRPCFDYCKFDQPYCMTKLLPDSAWPEIHEHIMSLISRGVLPRAMLHTPSPVSL